MAPNLDRHVVTAILVTHDGARWLPETLKALLTQTRPADRVVVADTGGTDAGSAIVTEVIGETSLIRLPSSTTYADAVAKATGHRVAPVAGDLPAADRVEWFWLLHDDSAPAPDALRGLLTTAEVHPPAPILGPKLRDWDDRRLLIEAGVTLDRTGRRDPGVEPLELDQGQHDVIREVMAVGSAGMLIRRDVWDQLGGLDPAFGLFHDDTDLCWRAYAAGHRVLLAPDAVVFHAEASARGLRVPPFPADARRSALLVLFANLSLPAFAATLARHLLVAVVRTPYLMARDRSGTARAELTALGGALIRSWRLRRPRSNAFAHSGVTRFQPSWPTLRRLPDLLAGRRIPLPTAEEGALRRWLRRPAVLLAFALTAVALVGGRGLIGTGGRLGGGPLMPAWGGAGDLWAQYLSGWHPVGLGSGGGSPPYVGVLALMATLTLGKPWLAVLLLSLAGVPLAGLTAYAAARRVLSTGVPVAVWVGATYALLPVTTGAVTTGRVGTIVVVALLPLAGLAVHRMLAAPARHAAWAVALALTVAMAFAPLTWVLVALVSLPARYVAGTDLPHVGRRLATALLLPPLLLLPWTLGVLAHPSRFLTEAGVPAAIGRPEAGTLLLLGPGGPGVPATWATAGLVVAGLAALLLPRRRTAVLTGWLLALAGLLVAILVAAWPAWPGVALMFAAGGVVFAASVVLGRAVRLIDHRRFAYRAGAAAVILAATSTPLVAVVTWMVNGTAGPLHRVRPDTVPLAVESRVTLPRVAVLHEDAHGVVTVTVLRDRMPLPGDEATTAPGDARGRLRAVTAGIASGTGGATALTRLGIGYVVVSHPYDDPLVTRLDATPDLTRLGRNASFALWATTEPAGRLMLLDGGVVSPLAAGRIDAAVRIPPGRPGRVLLLAEPAGDGWHATLDGHALRPKTADGWAQAYDVPASGGRFVLHRGMRLRHTWVALQGAGVLVVTLLAIPGSGRPEGRRRAADKRRAAGTNVAQAGEPGVRPGGRTGTEPGERPAGATVPVPGAHWVGQPGAEPRGRQVGQADAGAPIAQPDGGYTAQARAVPSEEVDADWPSGPIGADADKSRIDERGVESGGQDADEPGVAPDDQWGGQAGAALGEEPAEQHVGRTDVDPGEEANARPDDNPVDRAGAEEDGASGSGTHRGAGPGPGADGERGGPRTQAGPEFSEADT